MERFRSFLRASGTRRLVAPDPDTLLPLLVGLMLGREPEHPLWIVARTPAGAKDLFAALSATRASPSPRGSERPPGAALPVAWLPPLCPDPYSDLGADSEGQWAHLATLHRLGSDAPPRAVVTCIAALVGRTVPRTRLDAFSAVALSGDTLDRDAFLATLLRGGYAREDLATEPGTLAVRGGVLDVFPPHLPHPVRIDLFGDEVERMVLFDPESQRSIRSVELVEFPPVTPFLVREDEAEQVEARIRSLAGTCRVPSLRLATYLDDLGLGRQAESARLAAPGSLAFLPAVVGELEPVARCLPPGARVIAGDLQLLKAQEEVLRRRIAAEHASALERHRLASQPDCFLGELGIREIAGGAGDRLELTELRVDDAGEEHAPETWVLQVESVAHLGATLRGSSDREHPFKPVATALGAWAREGFAVHLVARGSSQRRRLRHLVGSYGQAVSPGEGSPFALHPPGIHLWQGQLEKGFLCRELGVAYVSDADIFGARLRRRGSERTTPEHLLRSFRELRAGDLVVHRDHGIGRFVGLVRMRARSGEGDFLELHYRDGAKLFLPVTRIALLQRYVSAGREGYEPPLDKLGGSRWKTARRKARRAAEKIASELLKIYAERTASAGRALGPPDELYAQFEATFPYEETPDQERAIREVLEDLQKPRPMNRVVCGDVGYGKTEVALRAAFKAVEEGLQVAVLVPTTILAEQHYLTMSERLRGFPVRIAQLSRFVPAARQRELLADLRRGRVDIVVGTHRLLGQDVRFPKLGLLVIDEEHRFGVRHKERIKKIRASVDVLTLSATPIPRTLHMALLGIRDLSTIATPPAGRQAVETRVARLGSEAITAGIAHELARGGQVYYVTPRIQGMARIEEELRACAPEARIAAAHGQMPPRELEAIMRAFIRGQVDVLLTTTIIESGIDVPNANTMFVHQAQRFGLAELYQLRGRIGRSHRKARCTFLIPDPKALTDAARHRIGVLQRMSKLGSGFALAMEDMEQRGTGNLLGTGQHGHIDSVGYETFMDLLQETLLELRGQPEGAAAREVEVQVDVEAFIPDDYLPDSHDRLVLYRRLASAGTIEDLQALVDETRDRYGRLPEPLSTLVRLMNLRVSAAAEGVIQVVATRSRLRFALGPEGGWDAPSLAAFVARPSSPWKLTPDMALERPVGERQRDDLMETSFDALRELRNFRRRRG